MVVVALLPLLGVVVVVEATHRLPWGHHPGGSSARQQQAQRQHQHVRGCRHRNMAVLCEHV